MRTLLAPGVIGVQWSQQVRLSDGARCGLGPLLGWKAGEEPPFTPGGLERLMSRRGLGGEVAEWKLARGDDALSSLSEDLELVVQVLDPADAGVVCNTVTAWTGRGRLPASVVVELPEQAVAEQSANALACSLRSVGADVAVYGCSGDLSAVRAIRALRPRYLRVELPPLAEEALMTSFRMSCLVAAAEGWKVRALGVVTADDVSVARQCGVSAVEGRSSLAI